MAVELCKVSLWMEAVEPGLPLTFLDSHIQHGNALLGTTPGADGEGDPRRGLGADRGRRQEGRERAQEAEQGRGGRGSRALDRLLVESRAGRVRRGRRAP